MGNRQTKTEEIDNIKAVEEMDDNDLSGKDKLFKKAIMELYKEIKEVKDRKSDKIMYKLPAINLCSYSLI